MCDYCHKILGELTIPHKVIECQYRRSMNCYICCSKGHTPDSCPDKIAAALRSGRDASGLKNLEMTVIDSDAGIKFILKLHNIPLASTQQGNRNLLYDLANSLTPPRAIVFVGSKKNEIHSQSVQEKAE